MNESNLTPSNDGVVKSLTPEIYKTKFAAVLSKMEATIQGFHNTEAGLVYNEDGLKDITKFVDDGKKALAAVEEERKKLKAPIILEGKNIDAGAALISTDLQTLVNKADKKKQQVSAEIAARALLLKEAEEKKNAQLASIDNFIMTKSEEIASANSLTQLLHLEKLVNLETANTSKYGEHLPLLKTRAESIRKLITEQKLSVKELTNLEKVATEATESGNDEKVLEVTEKAEEIKAAISQRRTDLIETAVGQATNSGYAQQVVSEAPKPARRSWAYEAVDLPLLYKKNPELVILSLNDEAVKKLMRDKKEAGTLKEETINGLKIFYLIKY